MRSTFLKGTCRISLLNRLSIAPQMGPIAAVMALHFVFIPYVSVFGRPMGQARIVFSLVTCGGPSPLATKEIAQVCVKTPTSYTLVAISMYSRLQTSSCTSFLYFFDDFARKLFLFQKKCSLHEWRASFWKLLVCKIFEKLPFGFPKWPKGCQLEGKITSVHALVVFKIY